MSFKEVVELALKGCRIRKSWWKKEHYITLRNNGFYDENDKEYFIENYGNDWEVYIELWEE